MLHHILQRIGLDAFALAAGFPDTESMMRAPGARAFVWASMRVTLEAEARLKEKGGGGNGD